MFENHQLRSNEYVRTIFFRSFQAARQSFLGRVPQTLGPTSRRKVYVVVVNDGAGVDILFVGETPLERLEWNHKKDLRLTVERQLPRADYGRCVNNCCYPLYVLSASFSTCAGGDGLTRTVDLGIKRQMVYRCATIAVFYVT
jgi:hypothetical protein